MKKYFLATLLIINLFFITTNLFAFSDKNTHPDITEVAVYRSLIGCEGAGCTYLKDNLGFNKKLNEVIGSDKIITLLRNGAQTEDSGTLPPPFFMCTRGYNHFYDPLTQQGLDEWTNLASLDIKILLPAVSYLTPMEKGSSLLLTFIPISEKVNEYYESNVLMHGATS